MMMTTVTTDREDDDGVVPLMDSEELDVLAVQLLGRAETGGLELLGPGGVLTELTKRVLEKGLAVELTDHLGYEKGDPAGWGSGNNRNGTSPKTLLTDAGSIPLDVPRDRNGTFDPRMVPKGERRLQGFNELVTALVARGLSVRDVQAHLQEIYGVEISPELVSKITDAIIPELRAWQSRPLDPVYPILYLDALVVKVRNDHTVVNKAAHIALGVDIDGRRHVLGVWLQREEGAKFWLGVLTELKNRGVQDVLIACCDGLTGFPDAIEAVWPQATVQTCVVHLIRNSTRFVSYKDRRAVVAALKPVYQAPTLDAAADALDTFELEWGDRYPAIVDLWRRHWDRFTPFLQFPAPIRKIIYTTNAIESINYRLRKVTKTKGHFPTDDAVLKLLYLAIRNIGTTRQGELGTGTHGWKQALNAFAIAFPGRLPLN